MDTPVWSMLQLPEFVAAVSVAETEDAAAVVAVQRAAEALDAHVAAIVGGGAVVAAVGYPDGAAPLADLEAVRPGVRGSALDVPGVGTCAAAAASLDHPPGTTLVVARPDPLTPGEAGLLRGMARVASLTMRVLHLLSQERAARQEVERLAHEQAALRRVATLMAAAPSPGAVFSAVAEEVARISEAPVAKVLRYETDGTATVVGGWGDPELHLPIGARLAVAGEGPAVSVRRTRRPSRTVRFAGPAGSLADAFSRAGVRAASGSPILVEGRLWGVVIAAWAGPEPPVLEMESRIPAFTELVATAVANAQARMELHAIAEEQAALRRVATLVARGVAPNLVFAAVAKEVGRVLAAADFTMVCRYDADGAVEVVGGWSKAGEPRLVGRRKELGGRNVSTLVFESGEPARVDRLGKDDPLSAAAGDIGMRSALGAPISVEGRLWGVMIVASAQENGLPAAAEHRLANFTELVATALANAQAREELRALADEQAALRRVATLVAGGARPRTVFVNVAEEVGRLLPADLIFIGRYEADGTATGVGGWSRTDEAIPVRNAPLGGRNVTAFVFETGRAARLDSYADASGAAVADVRGRGVRSAVGAPISIEGRLWGVMVAASTRAAPLPPDTEERLARFTALMATAIANAQAQAELTASRARIVATADETRRRIERDLHDGAQQRLVSLGLQVRAAQAEVPPEMEGLAAQLDRVVAGLNGALDELREFARGIHPRILAAGGLVPALRGLARRSPVAVDLHLRARGRLPEPIEVAAYYIVSEGLANAAKHAAASSVTVDVEAADGGLRVTVRDDGVGGAEFAHGTGLIGLKDRVEALGGRISLESPRGAGTCVEAELPLAVDGAAAPGEADATDPSLD